MCRKKFLCRHLFDGKMVHITVVLVLGMRFEPVGTKYFNCVCFTLLMSFKYTAYCTVCYVLNIVA